MVNNETCQESSKIFAEIIPLVFMEDDVLPVTTSVEGTGEHAPLVLYRMWNVAAISSTPDDLVEQAVCDLDLACSPPVFLQKTNSRIVRSKDENILVLTYVVLLDGMPTKAIPQQKRRHPIVFNPHSEAGDWDSLFDNETTVLH